MNKMEETRSLIKAVYMGCTELDNRIGAAVLPWIIEDMKLGAKHADVGLFQGNDSAHCVDDWGDVLFSHKYGDVLCFQAGLDEMSFAYIHEDKTAGKSYCHTFQCYSIENVKKVSRWFSHRKHLVLSNHELLTEYQGIASKIADSRKLDASKPVSFSVTYCAYKSLADFTLLKATNLKVDEIMKSIDLSTEEEKSSVLTVSCTEVTIMKFDGHEQYKVPIEEVACVSQGRSFNQYVCFVTQTDSKYGLHLLKVDSARTGRQIMRKFKVMMDESVTKFVLRGLCSSCPLAKFNTFCQKLNDFGKDTKEALSLLALSEFLDENLTEFEYRVLIKAELLNPAKPRINAFRHFVRLMNLVRRFFSTLQEHHVHNHVHSSDPSMMQKSKSIEHNLNGIILKQPIQTITSFRDHEHRKEPCCPKSKTFPPHDYKFKDKESNDVVVVETHSQRAQRRWKWAIRRQMQARIANKLQLSEAIWKKKLDYKDDSVGSEDTMDWFDKLIKKDSKTEDLFKAVKKGIPPRLRGRVWNLLMENYSSINDKGSHQYDVDLKYYKKLFNIPADYFMDIIASDIRRTFPLHPFFSNEFKYGQTRLYNILRTYSVHDKQVGYCQGMNFVAGTILIHSTNELNAFNMLNKLMNLYDIRKLYINNMYNFENELKKFDKLIFDFLPQLCKHFEKYGITSFMYATPWFLTIFASQYPPLFVARAMDFLFYEGTSALYKIGLSLLMEFKSEILSISSMEKTLKYISSIMPQLMEEANILSIITRAMELDDISFKLKTYEIQDSISLELQDATRLSRISSSTPLSCRSNLELANAENKYLIEQLTMSRAKCSVIEAKCNQLENEVQHLESLQASKLEKRRHTTTL